jgi:putative hemolysin
MAVRPPCWGCSPFSHSSQPNSRSSLAPGWIGEPALAHLVAPLLDGIAGSFAAAGSHVIATTISFIVITTLHIVLGELAPKGLALQRSEGTALWVVRPLGMFLFVLRPAILGLNRLGNLVLRLAGLQPGTGEESLHRKTSRSCSCRKARRRASRGRRSRTSWCACWASANAPIGDFMTPRPDMDWIDAKSERDAVMRAIRECRHEHLVAGRGGIDDPLGIASKKDLLDQKLDGLSLDPMAVLHEPLIVHEATIFKVLEQFKRLPVRLAIVVDEYGSVEGIVTQTDHCRRFAGQRGRSPGYRGTGRRLAAARRHGVCARCSQTGGVHRPRLESGFVRRGSSTSPRAIGCVFVLGNPVRSSQP